MTVEQKFSSHLVPEQHRVRQATSEFKDFAIIWCNELVNTRAAPQTWTRLKEEMRARFVPPFYVGRKRTAGSPEAAEEQHCHATTTFGASQICALFELSCANAFILHWRTQHRASSFTWTRPQWLRGASGCCSKEFFVQPIPGSHFGH